MFLNNTLPRSMCASMRLGEIPLGIPRRDAQRCRCLHTRGQHVSTGPEGDFLGIGGGTCHQCDCQAFTDMVDWRRMRLNAWLATSSGVDDRMNGVPDWRTTAADRRAAHALALGADPDYICPATGLDMARAETIDPDWCCYSGGHRIMTVRPMRVHLVMHDLAGAGGHHRTLLIERTFEIMTVIRPDDWRAWHRWTLSRVHQLVRDHGWLTPHRRIEAFTVDLCRERITGWRGFEPLGAVVDIRWGNNPAGEAPHIERWWDR